MKKFMQKYFGLLGLVIYRVIAIIIRIPAAAILSIVAILAIVIFPLLSHREWECPRAIGRLFDWYCDN